MAHFDIKQALEEFTNAQVALEIVDGWKNENGEEVLYDYRREDSGLTIIVDRKTFEPADKKVVEALVNNVSFNIKEREKAESLLGEFIKREGRYIKIKEKEEREAQKERLKQQKQQEKEQKERQKQKEKEQKEELKMIIKDLEGEALEELLHTAQALLNKNEDESSMPNVIVNSGENLEKELTGAEHS